MAFMAHNWVELSILPITVEHDKESDTLVTLASEEAIAITEEEPNLVVCWDCHTSLTHDAFESACSKAPTAEFLNSAG